MIRSSHSSSKMMKQLIEMEILPASSELMNKNK
ncbi:hypothetical protein GGC63_006174 [Paenibacillus sp. OAS669]|nr:hypothetical protein [Paenibacillus sp. OAS669]